MVSYSRSGGLMEEVLIISGLVGMQVAMAFYMVFLHRILDLSVDSLFLVVAGNLATAFLLLPFAVEEMTKKIESSTNISDAVDCNRRVDNASRLPDDNKGYRKLYEIAKQAKRCAEVARLREPHTLKGHAESVVKLKGLDIEGIQPQYTLQQETRSY